LGETLKKLDRYIISNVVKIFIITQIAALALSLIIEFFERMDAFTASFRNFSMALFYLALRTPHYFNLILPLAFLIAMLIFFIIMIRGNEVITLRTSGVSTFAIMKPLVFIAVCFIILSFAVSEGVLPLTTDAAEYVYRVKIKKEESYVVVKNDRLWFKKENTFSNIDYFDSTKDTIRGLTVLEMSPTYAIRKRIDAEKGVWTNGSWLFTNVVERTFAEKGIASIKTYHTARDLIREPPASFKVVQRNPEEMGYKDLSRYIRRLKKSGHDVKRYLVDLYNKFAFPFVNLIMVFAAISMGLRYSKTKHISRGILAGIAVGMLYWFVHYICLSLGYSEIFPPLFAAWFTNLLFLSAGFIGVISLKT
jgi:lipopolysaccharide export system permease protein